MAERERIGPVYAGERFASRLHLKESFYLRGWEAMSREQKYDVLERMVGLTPLLRFAAPNNGAIWVKVESENPSESHYDRAALATLKTLETAGFIRPGDTLVESTSGSAGRSFAYFCNKLGYKLRILVPSELPADRRRDMERFRAVLEDVGEGGIGAVAKRYSNLLNEHVENKEYRRVRFRLANTNAYLFEKGDERICFSNHAESLITPNAFGQIGEEVIGQLPQGVVLDTFVATIGNGSTIKGISSVLRSQFSDIKVVGVEALACPLKYVEKYGNAHFEQTYGRSPTYETHDMWGASQPGYNAPFVELDSINEIRLVSQAEYRRSKLEYNVASLQDWQIQRQIGNTSAANLLIAKQIAEEGQGQNILMLFYDKADQYPEWQPYSPMFDMSDAARATTAMFVWARDREEVRSQLERR